MGRATSGSATARSKRRIHKATKGMFGSRSKQYRTMITAVLRAGRSAYHDRKRKKGEYRSLWITRITAACRMRGISYSKFIGAMRRSAVALNRKMLSEIAIHDAVAFDKLVAMAKG